jgi:hypothetical protein
MKLADRHSLLATKGITTMNAIARLHFTTDNGASAHSAAAASASQITMGLGPNQLTWLRRNIDSFKHAEEQRYQMRQDVVRAARIAGLI